MREVGIGGIIGGIITGGVIGGCDASASSTGGISDPSATNSAIIARPAASGRMQITKAIVASFVSPFNRQKTSGKVDRVE
jgi:hypothetical protein